MSATTIIRGENRRLTRNLIQSDGSPLAVSSLADATVELIQSGVVLHKFTYGTDDELTAGLDGTSLIFEITSAVTAALAPSNDLVERYTLTIDDPNFVADAGKAVFIVDLQALLIR